MVNEAKVANGAKATLKEELAKMKVENTELQNQVQGSQEDLQTIQHNYATISSKVMGLEMKIEAAEARLFETPENKAPSRETVVQYVKQ